ncbi:MAG: PTS sugar transporter subunit IIC [Deltaproteobacteria bacterium]|nr:PTS sugar transporter subunit IIC [Deltaproteobacteria bacterium]
MPAHLALALAAAALLNLDRLALGQNALGRPLLTGTAVGLILGLPLEGLTLGLWTEVLWLDRPPLGGAIIPNGSLAVASALAGLCLASGGPDLPAPGTILVPAMTLVPPLARLANLVEPATRLWSQGAHKDLEERLESDRPLGLLRLNFLAVLLTWLAGLALAAAGSLLACAGLRLFAGLSPDSLLAVLASGPRAALACILFAALGLPKKRLAGFAAGFCALCLAARLLSG